jgi:hypothetical protein
MNEETLDLVGINDFLAPDSRALCLSGISSMGFCVKDDKDLLDLEYDIHQQTHIQTESLYSPIFSLDLPYDVPSALSDPDEKRNVGELPEASELLEHDDASHAILTLCPTDAGFRYLSDEDDDFMISFEDVDVAEDVLTIPETVW